MKVSKTILPLVLVLASTHATMSRSSINIAQRLLYPSTRRLLVVVPAQPSTEYSKDEKPIMTIIKLETEAFLRRDTISLFKYHDDDRIAQSSWNNPNGSYSVLKGATAIKNNFVKAFIANPQGNYTLDVSSSEWTFKRLCKKWMWVTFTQTLKTKEGNVYTSYETRLMKKLKGDWKIIVMTALSNHGVD